MIALTLAVLLLQSTPAVQAAPAAAPLPLMKELKMDWKRKPDSFLMTKFFPKAAKDAGVSKAKVTLACTPSRIGALTCETLSESVPGLGFGEAAEKIVGKGLVMAWDKDGSPEGRRFRFEVKFGTWAPNET